MKSYKRNQLRRLIETMINEEEVDLQSPDVDRNIDAGEFPWPSEKPWWANVAVAYGSWDKDKNIEYDLEKRHAELVKKTEVGISGKKKNIFDKSFFDEKFGKGGVMTGAVQSLAAKSSPVAPPFLREILAPRLWIAKELNTRENSNGSKFYKQLKADIKEMTDYNAVNGIVRYQTIMFALRDIAGEDSNLLDKWKEHSDKQDKKLGAEKGKKDIIAGDDAAKYSSDKSDSYDAYSVGDDSDLKVYTRPNDTAYAYTGSPKAGWIGYKQSELKKGIVKPTKKFKSSALDKQYKANKLETNPMYAKKIKEKGKLSENYSKIDRYSLKRIINSILTESSTIQEKINPAGEALALIDLIKTKKKNSILDYFKNYASDSDGLNKIEQITKAYGQEATSLLVMDLGLIGVNESNLNAVCPGAFEVIQSASEIPMEPEPQGDGEMKSIHMGGDHYGTKTSKPIEESLSHGSLIRRRYRRY